MKKTFHITLEGKKELETELEELKGRRGAIAEKIANARDYGDLSENAEYDSAREEQGLVESRVAEIEDTPTSLNRQKAVRSKLVAQLYSRMVHSSPIKSLALSKLTRSRARSAMSHQSVVHSWAKKRVKKSPSKRQKARRPTKLKK